MFIKGKKRVCFNPLPWFPLTYPPPSPLTVEAQSFLGIDLFL